MKIGTAHFISKSAAIRYYRSQGENDAEQLVNRKLEEGLIYIGEPTLKPEQRLEQDVSAGRYFIIQPEKWRVGYETRQRGSIGEFETSVREVEAETVEEARTKAFDILQSEGLETRYPMGARRIVGKD